MNQIIKISSIVVIITALGLEIANFLPLAPEITTLSWFKIGIWLAAIPLVSHLVEAIIGVIYAYRQGLNPLKTAIYIFFTGTVGLVEILKTNFKNN